MELIAKHIIFTGRVQGVGFRYTTNRIAQQYALSGYVRNLSNGSVEMLAQGNEGDIQGCLKKIKEYFSGYISDTKINEIPYNPHYNDYKITF